jgi:hypothetical protein
MMTLTTLLLSIAMFAQAIIPDGKVSKDEVQQAIARFMASPGPGADAQLINKFAEESTDCTIGISPNVMPWVNLKPAPKYSGALMTAFVAGNVKSQLDSGKNADDPYAGLLSVFKVYDKLREKDKDFKVAQIDELIAKEKSGELKAWVEKAAKDAQAEHDKARAGK